MTNAQRAQRVAEHYEHAVRDLVDAHAKLARSPLVLAVRFRFDHPLDVYLLEVVENFPGSDEEPLLETEFAPNERFVILGKLHLILGSPRQLEHAMATAKARPLASESRHRSATRAIMKSVRKDGHVLYEARSPKHLANLAGKARAALGL